MKTESEYSSFSPAYPPRRRGWTETLLDTVLSVAQLPINLALSLVSSGIETLRPFSPQLIPLLICTLLIPVVAFFSLISGLLVWKSLAVGWEVPLYLQYGDGVQPYAHASVSSLVSSQPYDVSVHLVVPVSESNLALGNFMTELSLTTPSNDSIVSVRKPAIATQPRSYFFASSTTTISVPLLSSFTPRVQSMYASVTVGRKDNWRSVGSGEGRELSVRAATLRGTVVHQGVRGLLTRFPFALSCAAAGAFFLTCMAVIATCLLPVVLSGPLDIAPAPPLSGSKPISSQQPPQPPKNESDSESDLSSSDDDFPSRRRRARLSRQSSREVKREAPVTTIKDEPGSSSMPLRRRRSKIADTGSQSEESPE
ncbi:putative adipose-regulatory protein-domain-containing protein [Schizophyllum fasciatum]